VSALVVLYSTTWPFAALRSLRVGRLQYARELSGYGRFRFVLPETAGLSADDVAPDALIGIRVPGLPHFGGFVDEVREEPQDGQVQVEGRELAAVLATRLTPQRFAASGFAGAIAERTIRDALARRPALLDVRSEPGSLVPGQLPWQGDDVLSTLQQIAERTGDAWRVTYSCRQALSARWIWTSALRPDLRTQVHVTRLADPSYARTLISRQALVRAVGGQVTFEDRPSMVQVVGAAPFHARLGRTIEALPGTPRGTETELTEAATDARALRRRTQSALRDPWAFEEQLEFVVPVNAWPREADVGSVIGVRLGDVRFRTGVVRPVRILGYQVDVTEGAVTVIGGVLRT
jgi:hypothetical protein